MLRVNTSRCIDVETWEEAHYLARLDYEFVRDHQFTVEFWIAMEDDDSVESFQDIPFRMDPDDLELDHTTDEYLDPVWGLLAVNPVDLEGSTSPWCYAPSYRVLEAVKEKFRVPRNGGLRS